MNDGRQWNSFLKRRTPLRAKPKAKGRTLGIPKVWKKGKKVLAWEAARKRLKAAFERTGITTCELQMAMNCWHDNGLGFAHRFKRRNITTEAELLTVILCCSNCHDEIELLEEGKMADVISKVIRTRPVPVVV